MKAIRKKCSCLYKKEFPFKDQSYTKLINIDGGDSLVIGSKSTQPVAQSNSRYKCTKFLYNQLSYEKSDYRTVVKKAGRNDDSYFVLITRAVWLCAEDLPRGKISKLPAFVRVENDLISIKPIAAVEFYDGVFVSATRYIGQRYAVKIKEIKYLLTTAKDQSEYETAPMTVVQYDGLIALEEALFPPYQPGLPRELPHFEANVIKPERYYGQCSHDIPDRGEVKDFPLSPNSGRNFAIGTHQTEDLIFPAPGSPCPECFTINPGTPYHSVYRTEITEFVDSKFEAIINDEEFSKLFVIASRTVDVCRISGKSEAEFIRVEQKVIGVAAIRFLRLYSHTITQMTAIEMDAISQTFSAVFTEVKYMQADASALKQLREIPFRKLFIEKKVSTHIGKAIDIAYLIESADVVSRTPISDEGYDLRIGETTRPATMPTSSSYEKAWCQEYANKKIVTNEAIGPSWPTETKIFMKVNRDNTFYTLQQIAEDRQTETFGKPFYELVQRIIWICYIGQLLGKKRFIRVENRIRVLVPVRELESYDGVQIFKTRLENGQWSVEIVEVRHLTIEYPHDSIRFSVSFDKFNDREDPSDIMKYSSNNELSLLKKTGEEMVHTMGAGAKKGLNVRDTRLNDADYQPIIKQIGPGKHSIKFNLGDVPHIGKTDDIADCDVLQKGSYSSDKILPAFTIIDQQNGKAILTSGARTVHDRVFNDLSAELWKCTIRGAQSTQFLRVVYDHTLKANSEYDIGIIEYLQRDEVWLEVEDGLRVVRVRETKYLDIGNYQVLNYQGLHLLTPELSSEWKSGTQIIKNYQKISDTVIQHESMREIEYLDDLAHSLSINPRANNIITLDTRWQKTFGNAEMTLTCQKDSTGRFTSLETKLRINNGGINIFDRFFKKISIDFWICTDQNNRNGIVRVHHQFLVVDKLWKIEELRHFYGVTIFAGKSLEEISKFTYEIIVIKYHENGANYPIVKYDGKLTFKDNSRLPIQARKLNPYGVRDVHYTLNNRTVYRKQISQLGHTIQVLPFLTGYAKSPMDYEPQPLIIDCAAFDIGRLTDKNFVLDGIRPMIMWNQNKDGRGLPVRSLMTQEQLNKCFQHHFNMQICGAEVPNVRHIYRVESTLTGTGECKLAVIYYHDGVTVDENYGQLEIKIIRFYESNKLRPIKFDGFTRPVPEPYYNGAFREINYLPDVIRATNVTHGSEYGNTYEIGSRWEYELEATADVVKCEKSVGRDYNEKYATKVSFVREQQLTVISILRDSGHFTDVRQTIYNCKRGEQLVFLRVVNEFVQKMQTVSPYIYHHDGVEVGTFVYPDLKRTIKIREVKFVNPNTNKILKYVGELYIVTEMHSIVGRLYDGPASLREEKLEMLAYEKLWPATAMDVYSLDTLRTFMKSKTPDSRLPAVSYQHDSKYWIHINVGYIPGHRVYQVGRLWDEVYVADKRDPLICLQDQWNTQTVFQNYNYKYILPRVIEFYRGQMYELDLQSKRQLISAIGLKVWICANEKDTILRLELFMQIPSANISGYIHPQTVNIWHDKSQEISIMQLKETFYVSASTSKILKYDGELALINNYMINGITVPVLQGPVTGQPVPRKSCGLLSSLANCFRPKNP